jgi:hypothetical protein
VKLKPTPEAVFRGQVGLILIAVTVAIAAGRIAVVLSAEKDTAFLSANDRSRWATVAALVEDRTYQIDRLIQITDKTGRRRPWNTIDRVQHTGSDGLMHNYSSKPPLLSTMVAGVYAVAKQLLGMTLTAQPIYMTRIVLAMVNVPILLMFLVCTWSVIKNSSFNDFAKLAALAVTCFGTMLLPMSVSLNNHLPAAAATAVVMMIYFNRGGRQNPWSLAPGAFWAGVAAAFTVACELPALLMFVLWALIFFRQDKLSTLVGFVPGAAIVAAAFFGTNWIAHQSLIPPYAHRSDGPMIARVPLNGSASPQTDAMDSAIELPSVEAIRAKLLDSDALHPINQDSPLRLISTDTEDRWIVETENGNQRFALRCGGPGQPPPGDWHLYRWDSWYDYPGSYWMTQRRGVDRGESRRGVYAFHLTIGHYGLISLTPFWALVPIGLYLRLREKRLGNRWWLALTILIATVICLAFYISRPLIDRNYGGVSSSFRWMLWFAPLWLWALLPAAHVIGSTRWGRGVLIILITASVFSVATSLESPWQHPWIYRYLDFLGWLRA